MPDQKMSLEGILEQYSPKNEKPKTTVGRVDAQKIINSTIESPDLLLRDPICLTARTGAVLLLMKLSLPTSQGTESRW